MSAAANYYGGERSQLPVSRVGVDNSPQGFNFSLADADVVIPNPLASAALLSHFLEVSLWLVVSRTRNH